MAASELPQDLELTPLNGDGQTVSQWLSMFHLLIVVLDPYTVQSSAILDTSARVLATFRGADARAAFLCTADDKDTKQYLGPLADQFLSFADPDRTVVSAMELAELPALVVVNQAGQLEGVAEGWDPDAWQSITDDLAEIMAWTGPLLPEAGDPPAFA
ncbi:MAG: hypothetical protein ACERLM_05490, partial [Acidimicrobiales bacterium]